MVFRFGVNNWGERILKYLYICLFNEIFIIKNKVNFFDDVEFNQTLSEFLDKL
ncbi:Uncharacterised protein [Streptococcus pneumoniae]|nr:Uncharacterised protein [Streptococcus pneumoniae]